MKTSFENCQVVTKRSLQRHHLCVGSKQALVGKETSVNCLEAYVGNGKKDATKVDSVAGIHSACEMAIHIHHYGSRNMTNMDLTCLGE